MHRHTVTIAFLGLLVLAGFAQAANIGNGNLKVVPQASAIDQNTIHVIKWAVVSQIDLDAKFVLYYPHDFELNQNLTIIADTYNPSTLDGRLNIDSIDTTDPNWKKVLISRQDKTTFPDVGDTVGIKLGLVGNPGVAADYPFRLEVLTFNSVIEDSGSALIKINEPITDFTLQLPNTYPRAGQSFELRVENARDAEGNLADGIIEVSFENKTLQDFAAADGTLPDLVSIAVKDGTGKANQIIYKPEITQFRLKGTVSGGSTERYSPNLRVNYGDLAAFEMTGYPLSTKAGFGFDNPIPHTVTVKAFDSWQNLKRDYRGQVYFKSDTDSKAYFYYKGSGTPSYYQFTDTDDGQHTFPGDNFSLRTSGYHTFSVWNEPQTVSETSDLIEVVPGTISSFKIETPTTQTAGQSFNVRVFDAVDDQGNSSSGTIRLSQVGGGQAPNGQQPVFNDISVVNGSGSSFQSLVKAGSTQLSGTLLNTTVTATSESFTLLPGSLSSFTMANIPVKAQINVPFSQNVIVTAYDGYGNIKTNFLGQVSFASTDPNASLPTAQNFQSSDQGVRSFPGSAFILRTIGDRTIRVISGTVSKTSNIIEVTGPNSIVLDRIVATNTTVSQGQNNITVTMIARNNGTDPFENVSANLTFADALQNSVTTDYVTQITSGQGTIPAQTSEWPITFSVNVNSNATVGDITIDGSISGYYNGVPDSETSANLPDTWQVQRPAALQILSTTLDASSIPQGSSPNVIRVRVANNSNQNLSAAAVVNNIRFTFTNSSQANVDTEFPITPVSAFPATIAGNDTAEFTFNMESKATAPTGTITVATTVNYQDANIGASQPKTATSNPATTFDSISKGAIEIVSITPSDSTVTQGQTNDFNVDVQVRNLGGSAVSISTDPAQSYIKFKLGNQEYISNQGDVTWPPTQVNIPAGGTGDVRFTVTRVQNSVPAADLSILSKMTTTNGISSTSELSDVYGTLTVQRPETIVIQSVTPSLETVTGSDNTRPWDVQVVVQNTGGSDVFLDLANSELNFNPDSGFLFETPSVSGDNILEANETETLTFRVTRNGSTAGTATISATIHYEVINTNESKTASGGSGSVIVQQAANVVILSTTSSLPTVSQNFTSEWTVAVVVQNIGQADVDIDVTSDSTWLYFKKDNEFLSNGFTVIQPTTLQGKSSTRLAGGESGTLNFKVSLGTPSPVEGDYSIEAMVKSIELNRNKEITAQSTAQTSGAVEITTSPNITYVTNSLSPLTVAPDKGYSFSLMVRNTGGATVELDPRNTTFTLDAGTQSFVAELDPSFGTTVAGKDSTMLRFRQTYLASAFPFNTYNPIVQLDGTQNGQSYKKILTVSDVVTVGEAGDLALSSITPSVETVTRGQAKSWTVTINVTNNSTSSLQLKKSQLEFFSLTNKVTSQYTVQNPTGLVSGNASIASGQSDAVRFTITKVSDTATTGPIVINGNITMNDVSDVNNEFSQTIDNQASVTVQTPANLQVLSFVPSQTTITRGQTSTWYIGARVRNSGGSAVKLDADKIVLDLVSYGALFEVINPATFVNSGTDTLSGTSEDSLYFEIRSVDQTLPVGQLGLEARLDVIELNTNREIPLSTNRIFVTVQNPAQVRLEKVEPMIESNGKVNANGEFYVRILLKNDGSSLDYDHIRKATVRLKTGIPNGYSFPDGDTTSVFNLTPGDTAWTPLIKVNTPLNPGVQGQFLAEFAETEARNTGGPAQTSISTQNTFTVTTENPAVVSLDGVFTERDSIATGSTRPWNIWVPVRNTGTGVVELADPTIEDIQILDPQGNSPVAGTYRIVPQPLGVKKTLAGGEVDSLIYSVRETWSGAGPYTIKVTTSIKELNNIIEPLERSASTQVVLTNTAMVQVVETKIDSARLDETGVGYVNTNQEFEISTRVRNGSSAYLQSVKLVLESENSTVLQPDTLEFDLESGDKWQSFRVKADSVPNLIDGESFNIRVISAKSYDGGEAEKEYIDATAKVKIDEPARLQILSVENLAPNAPNISQGSNFDVRVSVRNNGTEDAFNVIPSLTATPANLVDITPLQAFKLAGGATDTLIYAVKARNDSGIVDLRAEIDQAFGVNQPDIDADIATALDDTVRAHIKPGALLVINSVTPTDSSIKAGDRTVENRWFIKVAVENRGQADLQFLPPAANDVEFRLGDQIDTEYRLDPPSALEIAGHLVLQPGFKDTLVYTVTRNGELAGKIDITVNLDAVDVNVIDLAKTPNPDVDDRLTDSGTASVISEKETQVWLTQTKAETNRSDNGFGLVNRGQDFTVAATVQAGQLFGVDSVIVELTSDYLTESLTDTIPSIIRGASAKAVFAIPAKDSIDLVNGEKNVQFVANIIYALDAEDGRQVEPRDFVPDADIANVRIQEPARLSYKLKIGDKDSAYVEAGKTFDVTAIIENAGRAPMGEGVFEVRPPLNYAVIIDGDTSGLPEELPPFELDLDQRQEITFTMLAPEAPTAMREIKIDLVQVPLDLNDSTEVELANIDSTVSVTTVGGIMSILDFGIETPEGARDKILSTEQSFTIRAVVRSVNNLTDRKATLTLPALNVSPGYVLQSQSAVTLPINAELDTLRWIVQAPIAAVADSHNFTITASGLQPGSIIPYEVPEDLTIKSVQRKASLALQSVSINGRVQTDDIIRLTRNTEATITTRVVNVGEADYDGDGGATVELEASENGLVVIDHQGPMFEGAFQIDEWTVSILDVPSTQDWISLSVSAGTLTDENTNQTVPISPPATRTFDVEINEGGDITIEELHIFTKKGGADTDTLSSGQQFYVTAKIRTERVREDSAFAILESAQPGVFVPEQAEIKLSADQTLDYTWTVNAPSLIDGQPNTTAQLYVRAQGIDRQSGSGVVENPYGSGDIVIVEKAEFSFAPFISSPDSLTDRLSTGQSFSISTKITHEKGNPDWNDTFVLRLQPLPAGFNPADNSQLEPKTLLAKDFQNAEILTWQLIAPNQKPLNLSDIEIEVVKLPNDKYSHRPADTPTLTIKKSVRVLDKAYIQLSAYLHDDPATADSATVPVRLGNTFTVNAKLENLGEAGLTGPFQVELTLPQDYSFAPGDSSVKSGTAKPDDRSAAVSWEVVAPRADTTADDNMFRIKIVDGKAPKDELSQQIVQPIAEDSSDFKASIRVILKEGKVAADTIDVRDGKTGVFLGEREVIMGLRLQNQNASGNTTSQVDSLVLSVLNKKGEALSPGELFDSIEIVSDDDTSSTATIYASKRAPFEGSTMMFEFEEPLVLFSNNVDSIKIIATIKSSVGKMQDFRFRIDDFKAKEEDIALRVVSTSGDTTLHLESQMMLMMDKSISKSFFNYPNPFGRPGDDSETKFTYYLKEESTVEIRIYTLTGDLVKTFDSTRDFGGDEWTTPGLHQGDITWNGENGMGHKVNNGVYLAYLITEHEEPKMIKIAVVK